ncbi:alcohol dehydrogenase [Helicobacter jaachi]|uniref:Alcohol dehydrogenase n=1 Tax=Helicobacter jaachi TaxID=1677920 RepID=A0A4U8T9C7_9HELI|nr:hypothetical protein [Helicobacter jaachi]TLD96359.1 alcohol dehydrogenase [Helicobacter jaachi]
MNEVPKMPQNTKGFCFAPNTPLKLSLQEKPLRALNAGETLIQNLFVGLNPVDYKLLDSFSPKKAGQIMGVDGVGIALTSYPNQEHNPIKIGQIYAYHTDLRSDGSFSTYSIVRSSALMPLVASLPLHIAASLPCPGLTAMQALHKVPLLTGRDVLVYGAGGALGRILLSLLVRQNARVSAVASKKHHSVLLAQGAWACYEYEEFCAQNLDSINGAIESVRNRFYAIFDTMGKASELVCLLGYYGHIVSILGRIEENAVRAFTFCPSLHEIALGAIHECGSEADFRRLRAQGEELFSLVLSGEILLPDIQIIDFAEIPQALSELKSAHLGRKFVAKVS